MITKEQVYEALQDCYDPEIPVNIVDLGLIYDVEVQRRQSRGQNDPDGAGLRHGHDDRGGRQRKDHGVWMGVSDATVDLVWDPPWNPSMIKDEAKQRLGIV